MNDINRVILTGEIVPGGPKISWNESGAPCTTFTVQLSEVGKDERVFKLYCPVEVWGKQHAKWCAETIASGMTVLVDGRLKWKSTTDRQGQKQGKLIVSAWSVSIVGTPTVVSSN
jgi:single-stranded DNA-binding protein